jgi:hypothetical protein
MGLVVIAISILAAAAVGITLHAMLSAPLGYQDDAGFHFDRPKVEQKARSRRQTAAPSRRPLRSHRGTTTHAV